MFRPYCAAIPPARARHPAEARLGEAEYYRVWCAATRILLNQYHRVEFWGWLVGWGEGPLEPPLETVAVGAAPAVATRAEVGIFLTTDGALVTTVELLPDADRAFASSRPDLWSTFLGRHDSLADVRRWLDTIERTFAPLSGWSAVGEATRQAEVTLAMLRQS